MNQTTEAKMHWSPLQEAIFEAVAQGQSLSVIARAGTGKTSTIVQAAMRLPTSRHGTYIVYNKRNAEEAKSKMPSNIPPATINSIGHRSCMKVSKVKLDADKLYSIARRACKNGELSPALALAKAAKTAGLVPSGVPGAIGLLPDTPEGWAEIVDHYDLDSSDEVQVAARTILFESISQARRGLIDFQDQIYMPALFGYPVSPVELLFVDEAQDLDPLQHKFLSRMLSSTSQLCAVGDPAQAIYAFRGALSDSMFQLEKAHNLIQLPLNVSYRCPKAVVREAQKYVQDIQPFDDATEGEVAHWKIWGKEDLTNGSWAIVCRNNAPLLELAFKFLRQGIPCTMLGRDIGAGLKRLVNSLVPKGSDAIPIEAFFPRLESWASNEIARRPKKEASVRDKVESLLAVGRGCKSSAELIQVLDQLFSKSSAPIVLSSIHKAKGLEWPNVIFLDSFRIPSKYATLPWEQEQEQNLAYVAITRAQQRLVYADVKHFKEAS